LPESTPLVVVEHLVKRYRVAAGAFGREGDVRAVDDLGFSIARGEVLALVGESGSGKSTVGRLLLRLLEPTSGRIVFDGIDLSTLSRARLRACRRRMQMIFQDPFASLNPHMRVRTMLQEALTIHGIGNSREERSARIESLLHAVGLPPSVADRFPHEFSGGQRQRLGIARALAVEPEFIVADEPISALDVSNQAQIMNVLLALKEQRGLTLLFISHNLAVVQNIADTVAVMYLGHLMEIAPAAALFDRPGHPYTTALLAAIPIPDPTRARNRLVLTGDVPNPASPPSGCVFRTRCPYAVSACATELPSLREVKAGHRVACIRHEAIADELARQAPRRAAAPDTAAPVDDSYRDAARS
jgi:oligopeptide/dipeptide ABC transporter ATP-binding protein